MNSKFNRKPKLASMKEVESLMSLRDMKSDKAQELLDAEGRRSAWSDELSLYDKWIKVGIDEVSVDLHYGVPIDHPYELIISLEECHLYYTDGLFAGIMPDSYRDPLAFNPANIMHQGFHRLSLWAHSLWTSIFKDQTDFEYDYDMIRKRMYICLDKKAFDAAV